MAPDSGSNSQSPLASQFIEQWTIEWIKQMSNCGRACGVVNLLWPPSQKETPTMDPRLPCSVIVMPLTRPSTRRRTRPPSALSPTDTIVSMPTEAQHPWCMILLQASYKIIRWDRNTPDSSSSDVLEWGTSLLFFSCTHPSLMWYGDLHVSFHSLPLPHSVHHNACFWYWSGCEQELSIHPQNSSLAIKCTSSTSYLCGETERGKVPWALIK